MAKIPAQSFNPKALGITTASDELDEAAKKLAAAFLPLSAIVNRVKEFGESIDGVRVPAVFAAAVFKSIAAEGQKLAQGIGSVNAAFAGLTSGLASVASQLTQSVMLPVAPMQALARVIAPFAAAFNPVVVEQFNLAITDLMAVIGSALTPVMAEVTKVIKNFADMLLQSDVPAMLSEILMTIVEAMKPLVPVALNLVQALLPVVKLFVDIFAPVIKFVAKILQGLVDIIHMVERAMYDLVQALMKMVPVGQRWRDRDFELERELEKKSKEGQSATGMGVRNVSVSTGGNALDALRQKVATSALKVGGDETMRIAKEQLNTAKEQLAVLKKMIEQAGGDDKVPQSYLSTRDFLGRKALGYTDEEADLAAREEQRIRQDGEGRGRRPKPETTLVRWATVGVAFMSVLSGLLNGYAHAQHSPNVAAGWLLGLSIPAIVLILGKVAGIKWQKG